MENPGFGFAYGWNIYYEKIMGTNPRKEKGFVGFCQVWSRTISLLLFIWIPQAASLYFLWGDFNSFINCLMINMSIGLSVVKLVSLHSHREEREKILDFIEEDWRPVRPRVELEIMMENAKMSKFISILSFTISNSMFVEWVCLRIWILMNQDENEIDPRLAVGLLQETYFPFDTSELKTFVFMWIGQFFSTHMTIIVYSGPDSLLSVYVLHICGQLKIIRNSLKNLVNDTTIKDPAKFWQFLSSIVEKHQQLSELSDVVRKSFSTMLLLEILVCSVTFCFQGYVLLTIVMDRNGEPLPVLDILFSFLFGGYTVIHLYIHCYVGDRLLYESTSVSDAFYETEWYKLAPTEAKAFLHVCPRAIAPFEIKAGKFCTFNLQLFNSVLKNSMGYLSMLMAVKDRLLDNS